MTLYACKHCGRTDRNLHYRGHEQTGCDGCGPGTRDGLWRSATARTTTRLTWRGRWLRLLCRIFGHRTSSLGRCARCHKPSEGRGWPSPERYR